MEWTGDCEHVIPDLPAIAERALAKVGAQYARLVATDDFDRTVQELLGNDTYQGERSSGRVAAKTFIEPAATVVLNLTALSTLPDDEIERTIAHEACHVLMYDRREDSYWHHDLASDQAAYDLISMASGAIEEFRCEVTVVRELGYPGSPNNSSEHLSVNLHNTNVDFLTAVSDPTDDDLDLLVARVTGTASALSKTLAVTAAGATDLDGDLSLLDLGVGADDWADYVEPTWQKRLALLRRLPGAKDKLDAPTLREVLLLTAEVERDSLRAMGFSYESRPGGIYFQRVASDEHLYARVARAVARSDGASG